MSYWLKQTASGNALSGVQFNLGQVTHETISKNANLMIIPMPLSDSNSTDVFDYMGTTREITIEGNFNSSNTGSVLGFIGSIQAFVFGQQAYAWYNSDVIAGSIPVKVSYVNIEKAGGEPITFVKWNAKFTESTQTS